MEKCLIFAGMKSFYIQINFTHWKIFVKQTCFYLAVMDGKIQLRFIQIQMSSLLPTHDMFHTQLYHVTVLHATNKMKSYTVCGLLVSSR